MPYERPADSLGRALISAQMGSHVELLLAAAEASLAMPYERPADSLGRPLISAQMGSHVELLLAAA
jgi:hypothetical protein